MDVLVGMSDYTYLVSDFQDENRLSRENDWGPDLSDKIEALGWQFSEENSLSPELFNNKNAVTGSQLLLTADEEAEEVMDQVKMSRIYSNSEIWFIECQNLMFSGIL